MNVLQQLSADIEALVARTAPAVVGVEDAHGQGSGVVLSNDGYVLTNSHVVREARGGLALRLSGGERVPARVVGADARTDLAVVRSDAAHTSSLSLSKGERITVGQLVLAIGNPFRFERSVSLGVVSAVDRFLPAPRGTSLEGLIQTDAAINPGNSGGPLVDVEGRVVGINTAMIPYAQGIGFAIPASTADWVAAVLIQRGTIRRPYVGVAARSEQLSDDVARVAGQSRGVRVISVEHRAPAHAAGLRDGDIVLTVNGEIVRNVDELQRVLVLAARPEAELGYWRGGATSHVVVRPAVAPAA